MTRLEDLPYVIYRVENRSKFGQFDKKIAPKKVRNVVLLKLNYQKNPARFEEKLTIFSLFFTIHTCRILWCFDQERIITDPKKEDIIADPKKEDIIADPKKGDIIAEFHEKRSTISREF